MKGIKAKVSNLKQSFMNKATEEAIKLDYDENQDKSKPVG